MKKSITNLILLGLLVLLALFGAYCVLVPSNENKNHESENEKIDEDIQIIPPPDVQEQSSNEVVDSVGHTSYNDYDMIEGSNYYGNIQDDVRIGSGPSLNGRSRHVSEY